MQSIHWICFALAVGLLATSPTVLAYKEVFTCIEDPLFPLCVRNQNIDCTQIVGGSDPDYCTDGLGGAGGGAGLWQENAGGSYLIPNASVTSATGINVTNVATLNIYDFFDNACPGNQFAKDVGTDGSYSCASPDGKGNTTEQMQDAVGGAFDFTLNYSDAQNSMGVNQTWINDTVEAITRSIIHLPIHFSVESGTLNDGGISDMNVSKDDKSVNISEVGGANPLTIIINFTNVDDFNSIVTRLWYIGGSGHELAIGLYDFDDGEWEEEYGEISDMEDFAFLSTTVSDSTDHVDSFGNVSLRLRHIQTGNPSHELKIDYASLVDGFTTITTSEHDALSGRENNYNHPWALPIDGTRQLTANWDAGSFNITAQEFLGRLSCTQIYNGSDTDFCTDDDTTIPDTNASTECVGTPAYALLGNGSCHPVAFNDTDTDTFFPDTNASTECSGDEVLLGNTTCLSSAGFLDNTDTFFPDTNASTECSGDQVLLGNTTCLSSAGFLDNTDTFFPDTNCSVDNSCSNITYNVDTTLWDKDFSDDFTNIVNFTGTLTDGKICTYDLAGGEIDCDYTDQTGDSVGNNQTHISIYVNDTASGSNAELNLINDSDYGGTVEYINLSTPQDAWIITSPGVIVINTSSNFLITVHYMMEIGQSSAARLRAYQNDVIFYDSQVNLFAGSEPNEVTLSFIRSVTAGDNFSFTAQKSGFAQFTLNPGSLISFSNFGGIRGDKGETGDPGAGGGGNTTEEIVDACLSQANNTIKYDDAGDDWGVSLAWIDANYYNRTYANASFVTEDTDTTYTAGTGLILIGTEFSPDMGNFSAEYVDEGDDLNNNASSICSGDEVLLGNTTCLSSAGFLDNTDTDTTYTAGTGLLLIGTEFSPDYGNFSSEFIDEGQAAGGDLSGTYPNPTVDDSALLDGFDSSYFCPFNDTINKTFHITGDLFINNSIHLETDNEITWDSNNKRVSSNTTCVSIYGATSVLEIC